jgi:glycine/D-amino acid oxidase-like deaminating enzyme
MFLDLNRRSVLAAGGAAAALGLSGCATTGRRGAEQSCTPLSPLKVEPERMIRAVAGLRPYRASGFVVRREQLGDKALVHNYGHGGAGITLSWGSSKLATELGLQGHQGAVGVIGAGIMGLTTARLVQEAGFPVAIYTAAMPPDTTSNIAGGQISPFGHFRDDAVTDEWRRQFMAAMDYSWRRFQLMVGIDYGVRWLPTFVHGGTAPDGSDPLDRFRPRARMLSRGEHPFDIEAMWSYETMYVETPRFLSQLVRDVLKGGGRIKLRRFAAPADIAALEEKLVFNCTGLGSRELFGDTELTPIRGQLAVLGPQPDVRYAFTGRAGYMFPRGDGVLLGGTFERNVWSTVPEPAAIQEIVDSHRRVFEGFRCAA